MKLFPFPSTHLLTNDQAEVIVRHPPLPSAALRYTHFGFRGLFGGIWRLGRTFYDEELGLCFGPEVFYHVGSSDAEAMDAYEMNRETRHAVERQVVEAAFQFARSRVASFGGEARLHLAGPTSDRHILLLLSPIDAVMSRFTPSEWFAFWKGADVAFLRRGEDNAEPPTTAAATPEPELASS